MKKSNFPPNNPFKDILSPLKRELSSKEQNISTKNLSKTADSKFENRVFKKDAALKVVFENKITQEEVDDLSDWLIRSSSKKLKKPKIEKKEYDRPLNPSYKNRPRNEAEIEALKNPLDRLVKDPLSKPIIVRTVRTYEEEIKITKNHLQFLGKNDK